MHGFRAGRQPEFIPLKLSYYRIHNSRPYHTCSPFLNSRGACPVFCPNHRENAGNDLKPISNATCLIASGELRMSAFARYWSGGNYWSTGYQLICQPQPLATGPAQPQMSVLQAYNNN